MQRLHPYFPSRCNLMHKIHWIQFPAGRYSHANMVKGGMLGNGIQVGVFLCFLIHPTTLATAIPLHFGWQNWISTTWLLRNFCLKLYRTSLYYSNAKLTFLNGTKSLIFTVLWSTVGVASELRRCNNHKSMEVVEIMTSGERRWMGRCDVLCKLHAVTSKFVEWSEKMQVLGMVGFQPPHRPPLCFWK